MPAGGVLDAFLRGMVGALTIARRSTYLGTHFYRIAHTQGDATGGVQELSSHLRTVATSMSD
jgi:hypothetical protein